MKPNPKPPIANRKSKIANSPIDHTTVERMVETAVAIADGFYSDREKSDAFYNHYAEELGGFPGIWKLISEVAMKFESQWLKDKHHDDNWMDTAENIAGLMHAIAETINPSRPEYIPAVIAAALASTAR